MAEILLSRPPAAAATILPFPADRARPPSPQTRLSRALDLLRAALAEQRQAAHALEDATGKLKTTLAELQARVEAYRDGLDSLAGDVARLNGEARRLDAWADSALTRDARWR
jgi:septal ring factor EnvC (AmiA/AmiB activator)